jgi:lambda family phage portal protein
MSLVSRARAAWSAFRQPERSRGFNAAQAGRLYSDWVASATSSDAEIRNSFRKLLDRSRDLERNNDYQRGFLGDCESNIVGSIRYDLRMDCGEYTNSRDGKRAWQPDRLANSLIEQAWIEWSKKGTCTICGRYSWRDVKRLAVRSVPRDGNFIARKIRGPAARNRFNFALQIWEIDHLDLQKFQTLPGGGEIRFGIESDAQKRVTAFWLFAQHPGDFCGTGSGGYSTGRSIRFPADEIYHLFVSERSEQSIGIPWCVSAITRLRQLCAFEEAAVIAARLGASNAVFFETTGEGEWSGETDADGRAVMDIEPGVAQQLPSGWKASSYTPKYPDIATGDFRKAMLRGISTGWGTSYVSLGNDLESVNFSSARVGLFDEREGWKMHQLFFDENLSELVFADWLESSLTVGAIPLPLSKFAKLNRPKFKSRRWPFIDPAKELEAAKTGIALRLTSRRQVIEEQGGDVEEVFHDNLDDEKLAEGIGLTLSPPDPEPEAFGDLSLMDEENENGPRPPSPKKKPSATAAK